MENVKFNIPLRFPLAFLSNLFLFGFRQSRVFLYNLRRFFFEWIVLILIHKNILTEFIYNKKFLEILEYLPSRGFITFMIWFGSISSFHLHFSFNMPQVFFKQNILKMISFYKPFYFWCWANKNVFEYWYINLVKIKYYFVN